MEIISHRCRGFGEADNSLAALKKALKSNIDAVEIDVRQGNHCLLVWHDPSYKKRKITTISVEEANHLQLITFDECCAYFKKKGKGKKLHVDIKSKGMEQEILDTIKKYKIEKQIIIVSWHESVLKTIHWLNPKIPLSFSFHQKASGLFGSRKPIIPWPLLPRTLKVKRIPITYVNIVFRLRPSFWLTRRLKKRGYKVIFVNVDTTKGNQRLKRIGAHGSMTNNPLICNS